VPVDKAVHEFRRAVHDTLSAAERGKIQDDIMRVLSADLRDFLKLLDQYKIGATLLAPDTPAVALLDRLPDWPRVYSDDVAVVH
jgi:hypothetical protein